MRWLTVTQTQSRLLALLGLKELQGLISLRQDKTEGRLLRQLHGSSLAFHKKHCTLFTLQASFCGNAQ